MRRPGYLGLPSLAAAAALIAGCASSPAPRAATDASAAPDAASVDANGGVRDAQEDPSSDTMDPRDAAPPLRILFIGNSYTNVNDLPQVVRALGAVTPGAAVEVASVLRDGARLRDHWESSGARARVEDGRFGAVVLQGQSVEPITASAGFDQYAQQFSTAVGASGARGVWFATWARRAGDPFYAGPVGTPAEMTARLEARYQWAAHWRGDRDAVARVGAAWQLALAERPGTALHAEDGSHPSAAGSLLAACVLLQALTGQAPRVPDPPPLGLDREVARALCALAPRVACAPGMAGCGG